MNNRKFAIFFTISFLGSFIIGLSLIDPTSLGAEGNVKSLMICSASFLLLLFSMWILNRDKRTEKQDNPPIKRKRIVAVIIILLIYVTALCWFVYSVYLFFENNVVKSIITLLAAVCYALLAYFTKKNLRKEYR